MPRDETESIGQSGSKKTAHIYTTNVWDTTVTNCKTFWRRCRSEQLSPNYIHVTVNGNNQRSTNTKNAATKYRLNQEIKHLYKKIAKMNGERNINKRRCITLITNCLLDFVYRPDKILKHKITTFRKLVLLRLQVIGGETPTQIGPLNRGPVIDISSV
jgi:hypothetical protein